MLRVREAIVAALLLAFAHAVAFSAPLDEAERLLGDGRYEEARRVLEPIVAANPYDGMAAYCLGLALARTGRCAEALPLFDAALEIGVNGGRNGMRLAQLRAAECAAALGDSNLAVARLREAWTRWGASDIPRLTSADLFDAVREHGLLAPLTGHTPNADAGDRAAQRTADLAYFDRLVRETHPHPFHRVDEATWRAAVAKLEGGAASITTSEFNLGLMRLAAMIGDGHTSVYPLSHGEEAWRLLPIYLLYLADGWVVAAAAPEHADLVGARIESVEGRPYSEVFAQVRQYVPGDNEMTARWLAGVALQCYESYVGLGLARDGAVSFDLTLSSGERRTVALDARAIDRDPNSKTAPAEWPAIGRNTLWLRDPATPFTTHWIDAAQTLYVQLNQVADAEDQSLASFGKSVYDELVERQARSIIIDLRHNSGGNATLAYGFLREIDRHEPLRRPDAIVALIGPRSYSATMEFVGRLERDMGALFVGWPTGGRPNGYSSERTFELPYSEIRGSISARWHQDGASADDLRRWMPPDIAVWPTSDDIRAGRDPVLDAALELVRE